MASAVQRAVSAVSMALVVMLVLAVLAVRVQLPLPLSAAAMVVTAARVARLARRAVLERPRAMMATVALVVPVVQGFRAHLAWLEPRVAMVALVVLLSATAMAVQVVRVA